MRKFLMLLLTVFISASTMLSITVSRVGNDNTFAFERNDFPKVIFTVRYEGIALDGGPNWGEQIRFEGIPVVSILEYLGGMSEGEFLEVVASDGYSKAFPFEAIYGGTPLGKPFIGYTDERPYFVFNGNDGEVSNKDMLNALGEEFSHYKGEKPSAKGLLMKDVFQLIISSSDSGFPESRTVDVSFEETRWEIAVRGMTESKFTSSDFDKMKGDSSLFNTIDIERKESISSYSAVPLGVVIYSSSHGPSDWSLSKSLWDTGYDITLVAEDGYSVTFNTSEVSFDSIYLTDEVDGILHEPSVVGEISGNLWVKKLSMIEMEVKVVDERRENYRLTVRSAEKEKEFSIADLESNRYYIEDYGQYTTLAGSVRGAIYGGVSMKSLISEVVELNPESTIKITAVDGYEMIYSARDILNEEEGIWIIALKQDGEYLPEDPGYLRTIKVGPSRPNIDGHSSISMVSDIEIVNKEYSDYTLKITGFIEFLLDRSTIDSGVSCHKQNVVYTNKGEDFSYSGIPLWLLFAFSDDPDYAPHMQDSSIISYNSSLAEKGYKVEIIAEDGFAITLDSKELHMNNGVILATTKNNEELPEDEWPLVLVWDKTIVPPEGIKSVKKVAQINLLVGKYQ